MSSEAAARKEQPLPLLLHLRVVSRFHFHALALTRPIIIVLVIVHMVMDDDAAGLKLAIKKGAVGRPFQRDPAKTENGIKGTPNS